MRRFLPALALVLAAAVPSAAADLAPAPFAIKVSPSVPREDGRATVRIDARDAGGPPGTNPIFDIYVVRVPSGPPFFKYLEPSGHWTQTPAAYQRNAFLPRFVPLSAEWREEGPTGWMSLLLVFPRAGGDPSDRATWVFQPVLKRIRIAPRGGHQWSAGLTWMAALTIVAVGLVGWVCWRGVER